MKRARLIVAAALLPVLTACGALKLEQLPAPKGVSGATYHVTAQFSDVSNLVEGAKVKLQGVVIGVVTSITTHDFRADVGMDIQKKFPVATASTMQVRFNTPLGEDFISISSPETAGQATLADGAMVPLRQTSEAPGIEDTFAAVSLLLNGGGLSKLHIIATELDAALKGRTGDVRDALVQLHKVITNFDANKGDFDKTLTGLAQMSASLNAGTSLVNQALSQIPSTLQLLTSDTAQVRQLLGKVATLGTTVEDLLSRSQADMIAYFDKLRPTLDELQNSENNLLPTFNSLIRFGQLFDRAAPGDYLNLDVTVQFLLNAPPERPTPGGQLHGASPASAGASSATAAPTSTATDSVTSLLTGGLR